jgi:erythromycin esterase-like protein
MWRNREVVRFLRWLRAENAGRSADMRVGFYGLDLYSLHRSMARVIEYLEKVDPAAAGQARRGYACFDVFGDDVQVYGYEASLSLERSCEDEVVEQLVELRRRAAAYAARDGRIAADEYFAAEQNARVVCDAEAYYRAMFRGGAESWNLRDRHMMATLDALIAHSARQGGPARAIVWAHNRGLATKPCRLESIWSRTAQRPKRLRDISQRRRKVPGERRTERTGREHAFTWTRNM